MRSLRHCCSLCSGWGVSRARSSAEHRPPERAAAVQKLHVLAPGPGDIAVSYSGKTEQCGAPPARARWKISAITTSRPAPPSRSRRSRTWTRSRIHPTPKGRRTLVRPLERRGLLDDEPVRVRHAERTGQHGRNLQPGRGGDQYREQQRWPHHGSGAPGGKPIDCDDGGGTCFGWFPVGTPIKLEVKSGNQGLAPVVRGQREDLHVRDRRARPDQRRVRRPRRRRQHPSED